MANKMLIDAMHPEETRVVVLRGSRIEEFDFESASKRQLRGNIYLAKVIRVEPSLQAAFVDYGGNRHGFLAFSEIHPDYYQIPMSDRQALLAEEEQEEPEEEERRPRRSRRRRGREGREADGREGEAGATEARDHAADEPLDAADRGAPAMAAAAGDHGDETVSESADLHADAQDAHDFAIAPDAEPAAAAQEDLSSVAGETSADRAPVDLTAALIERADMVHDEAQRAASPEPGEPPVEALPVAAHDEVTERPAAEPHASPELAAVEAPTTRSHTPEAPAAVTAQLDAGEETLGEVQGDAAVDTGSTVAPADAPAPAGTEDHAPVPSEAHGDEEHDEDEEEQVEHVGGDALEEVPRRAFRPRRQYKIQEVIKRRQVLLVQVVKEERGNKGAALTTYLSLAGRYSVLMPNTARGGGISRKITDAGDRQRLKTIAQDLEVPDGMGVILRTAGASRSKPEVKRDFEYLMRAWETVRETTLASTAPTLVYEEGSLIKRAIRDLYNSNVDEIVVAGDEGYREAKAFMRLLQPSHLRNVVSWRDPAPLFAKNGAEAQLDAMFHNHVTLKSGGYLVINQTEALVAIDVNSGRSTREHNIEDTALRTNLEAADEVARQLRLRDLAGLIVVDFIDMEEGRNNRAVEKRMKDALKDDRARIQIGRISHFGLLEMSRQRIRTGVLEGSTEACPHCAGAGTVRSTASIALFVLRALEEALLADRSRDMTVRTRSGVALYILNNKRAHLTGIEERFGVSVTFAEDATLIGTSYCGFDKGEPATGVPQMRALPPEEVEEEYELPAEDEDVSEETAVAAETEDGEPRRKRRRRRGRGRDAVTDGEASAAGEEMPQPSDDGLALPGEAIEQAAGEGGEADDQASEERNSRRRRSRRGGRRSRGEGRGEESIGMPEPSADVPGGADGIADGHAVSEEASEGTPAIAVAPEASAERPAAVDEAPLHGGTPETPTEASVAVLETTAAAAAEGHAQPEAPAPAAVVVAPAEAPAASAATPMPAATDGEQAVPGDGAAAAEMPAEAPAPKRPDPVSSELDPSRPKKSGWWSRAKATLGG